MQNFTYVIQDKDAPLYTIARLIDRGRFAIVDDNFPSVDMNRMIVEHKRSNTKNRRDRFSTGHMVRTPGQLLKTAEIYYANIYGYTPYLGD